MAERLSLNEVSRLLKMSPAELRAKCEAGDVEGAERAGGHWFFPSSVVKDVADQLGLPLLDDLSPSDEPPSAEDISKMEISTANLDGALPNPFGDAPRGGRDEPTDGGADVLFGDLDEGGDDNNDMRTVMGSADDLARPSLDEIRLEIPKDEPSEDTAVLSGELDVEESGDDMRTVMGSAALFGGDQQIGLRDAPSSDFGQPFAAPSNQPTDEDAAVLGDELEPPSGDMHTLMGSANQFGGDRPSGEQVRIDAPSGDVSSADLSAEGDLSPSGHFTPALEGEDEDAAVLGGELEAPSGDMHTMMGGAAQFGLGNQTDPIDLTARNDEPSSYHEAFGLDEASDDVPAAGEGGMHTMVGDASQFGFNADSVRLDLSGNEPPSSITNPSGVHATEEDSDDVAAGGMHTMVGDASQFGLGGDQVKVDLDSNQPMFATPGSGSSINDDAAVLSGDLDVDDSNDTGTVMGSAAELAAAESGEVKLDSAGNTPGAGSSINDNAAVLSGDLDVDDSGEMRTALGGLTLSAEEAVGLSGGERDEEPSAIDQSFEEVGGEGGGMRTMVGDASQMGLHADEIRLDFTGRGDDPAGSSITEAISPSVRALEDSDEVAPTGGGMHTMVGDAADFGFNADKVRVDLAGRDEVPIGGSSLSANDSSVNLVGSSINDDSGAVLSGDLDVDDSGDMRTIMGGPDQFTPGPEDRVNVTSALDDGSAVLSGDLDADAADAGDMRTLMASSDPPPDENIRVASTQSAGESDALVLSGNLDASESSSSMRTEVSGAYGGPLDADDDSVRVADAQRGDSSDRILLGQEDLGDSSDYSPAAPTLLGISPLDSGSADQVVVGSGDVIDSDLRMNMGGPRPGESDVRLVPDQTNIDSDIRVSQMEDAGDSGGVWTARPHNPSDSQTFAGDDATPTLPEASQDVAEGTPGFMPPNAVPEESDLSINMESPDAGDEIPTATFAPPTHSTPTSTTGPGYIPVSYAPAADDTAELDPRSIEEDEPANSDVTPGAFYMDDDMTLAEHSSESDPAPSSSGLPPAPVEYADEELTIAEGIDMKPSPDKTSLSMNPGAASQPSKPHEPKPGDSGLTIGAGDELLLSGSDVTSEPVDSGVNTSMVNLDPESEEFVLGGGSDITIDPSASGIGLAGSGESGLGLAGSGIDLAEPPSEVGPGSSGLTLGESEDEFLLKPSDGGSGAELDADSDSGSQVIALDAASEDIGAYANPTMLGGGLDPYATPTMLGGDAGMADPYGAAGGLPDPMMNPGAAAGYAQPGYGAATPGLAPQVVVVPRVEVEYTPMQIVSLSLVSLVMLLALLMMIDLTVLNGAQWNGIQWTGSFVKPLVDLVGY